MHFLKLTFWTTAFTCLIGASAMAHTQTTSTESSQKIQTPIKMVVMDFGGVVGRTDKKQMTQFIAHELGISLEEARQALLNLKQFLSQGGQEEVFWVEYARSQGRQLPPHWDKKLEQARVESLKAIPGMVDIVKQLKKKGYGPALLSNTRDNQAKIKRQLGYYDLFNPVLLSNEIGANKPNAKAYQILLDRLQLPPQVLFFVDDHPENVVAARSMGMDAIHFESPKQFISELAKRGIYLDLPEEAAAVQTTHEVEED